MNIIIRQRTKHRHIVMKFLVFSAVILCGVRIFYRIVLAEPGQGGIKDGARRIAANTERYERTALTDSKAIEAGNLPGVSKTEGGEREERTATELDQIYRKFALLGTVVGDKDYALAIIEDKELRTQRVYKVGHSIYGGMISDILREKVIIRLHGKEVTFKIGGGVNSGREDSEAESVEGTKHVTVSLQDMEKAFEALAQPTSKVRLMPRPSDLGIGKSGIRLLNVEPGSPFDKIGFKSNDVIEEVNGNPVGDPYNAVAVYNLMKSVLPSDIFFESGLDLKSFLDGTDNRMSTILERMQRLFSLFQGRKDVHLTFTVGRERKPE